MRAYHRVDPLMDDRKGHYTPAQLGAFLKVQLVAGRQTRRGRFRSVESLKGMLPSSYAKSVAFLVEEGDLVIQSDGTVYVDGWDEWQEGDLTVGERMRVLRERRGIEPRGQAHQGMPHTSGAQRTANWRLRNKIFERDGFTCRYCGVGNYPRGWLVADHVIPAPSGPTEEGNLVTACRGCNKRKGGRTPEQAGMPLLPPSDVSRTSSHPVTSDVSPAIGVGIGVGIGSPPSGGVAREVDPAELAVRRLRNGGASEVQVETFAGLREQVGPADFEAVVVKWAEAPERDRYGKALDELVGLATTRKRSRGSRAVTPITSYDSLLEADPAA